MANITLVLCLIYFTTTKAAKILVFVPIPSVSHQVVFRPLTQELAKRGHDVTVVTTDPAFPKGLAPENLTEIDVHDISYNIWRETMLKQSMTRGTKDDLQRQVNAVFSLGGQAFELHVQTEEFKQLIKDRVQFDLIILEAFIHAPIALSHVFKAPVILMSSFGSIRDNFDIMGVPKHPAWLYPDCLHQRVYNLTIFDKIDVLYKAYMEKKYFDVVEEEENRIAKRLFGPETPDISELVDNIHMLFLNIYPIWELNRPVPPSVVFIGGIHQKTEKELPKELKSYLDSSKNGVIYISFGTNVSPSELPSHRIETMVKALSQLPYDVLWKWDSDILPGKTDNIRIEKWVPQSDLLKHPNIKLFVTQGGLQSTDEALIAGVPLIGIPLLGDQWFNVEHYVHHQIGLGLDMESLTTDVFLNALRTVVEDKRYRENVVRLRSLMHDQPQSALERAVWWTEHVLRHGGARHLRAPAANMTWAQYLDVELLTVLALSLMLLGLVAILSVYVLHRAVRRFSERASKLKSN